MFWGYHHLRKHPTRVCEITTKLGSFWHHAWMLYVDQRMAMNLIHWQWIWNIPKLISVFTTPGTKNNNIKRSIRPRDWKLPKGNQHFQQLSALKKSFPIPTGLNLPIPRRRRWESTWKLHNGKSSKQKESTLVLVESEIAWETNFCKFPFV